MKPFYLPSLCVECGAIVYGDDDCRICAARQEAEDREQEDYENARHFADDAGPFDDDPYALQTEELTCRLEFERNERA